MSRADERLPVGSLVVVAGGEDVALVVGAGRAPDNPGARLLDPPLADPGQPSTSIRWWDVRKLRRAPASDLPLAERYGVKYHEAERVECPKCLAPEGRQCRVVGMGRRLDDSHAARFGRAAVAAVARRGLS